MKQSLLRKMAALKIVKVALCCATVVQSLKVIKVRETEPTIFEPTVVEASEIPGTQPSVIAGQFDYGDYGASWAELGQCSQDAGQSPISFAGETSGSQTVEFADSHEVLFYRFPRYNAPVRMRNVDHGLKAELDPDGGVIVISEGGHISHSVSHSHTFKAHHLELHSPSEHTFGGKIVPLELQLHLKEFVGDYPGDQVAVASFGFYGHPSMSNSFLDALRTDGLPQADGEETMGNGGNHDRLDFKDIFGPVDQKGAAKDEIPGFWHYNGSLTTPPCSPGVKWYVRGDALPASLEAIEEFRKAIVAVAGISQLTPGNARKMQEGHGRAVHWMLAEDALVHPPPNEDNGDSEWNNLVDRSREMEAEIGGYNVSASTILNPPVNITLNISAAPQGAQLMESAKHTAWEVCLVNLKRIYVELARAEKTQALECKGVAIAKKNLAMTDPAGGVARVEAARTFNAQKALCDEQIEVTRLLQAQAEASKLECDRLSPPPTTSFRPSGGLFS